MQLHEEYIQRHKLDVPLIRYDQRSKILLRTQNPRNWRVLSFEWEFDYGHPGFWRCSIIEPIHSSYGKDRNWRQLFRPRSVYWDQYETFVKTLAKDFAGWTVADSDKNRELFCWEVLLYTCDNWFSRSPIGKNQKFLKHLSGSINFSLSLEERWMCFQEALSMMEDNSLSEFYSYNICNHLGSGSDWFAGLINNGKEDLFARAG